MSLVRQRQMLTHFWLICCLFPVIPWPGNFRPNPTWSGPWMTRPQLLLYSIGKGDRNPSRLQDWKESRLLTLSPRGRRDPLPTAGSSGRRWVRAGQDLLEGLVRSGSGNIREQRWPGRVGVSSVHLSPNKFGPDVGQVQTWIGSHRIPNKRWE